MAYIYTQHIDIDHFISAGIGIGITQQGTEIKSQMIVPVLKRDIYETETQVDGNGGYEVEVTGAENFVIPLLGFRTSTDNNDKYSSVFKGLRFTNTFNHFTFKSNGNSFLPDGYDATFIKYQGISIRYYNPSASNTTIAIPNNINSITFDENGISNPISGGTVRSRSSFDDGFIYLVEGESKAHFVRLLRWNTSSSGEIYNPVLAKGYFSTAYYDESSQYTKPFLVDGNRVDVYGGYEFFAGGKIIKLEDPGQSGGENTNGGTSGSREPYQYPSYGGSDGINIIGGNGTHKFFKESSVPVNGNNIVANLTDEENGDISSIFTNAHTSGTGGIRIYDLDSTKIAQLYGKIWDDNAADAISKYFSGNIGNTILRIYKIMVAPETTGTRNIYLGKYDTGISSDVCKQYKHMNLGTLQLPEYYGSFLDYQSKLMVFLPFSGWHDLMPDKYISPTNAPSTITVYLDVDFLAGIGTYNLMVTMQDGQVIIDNFNADFGSDVPITSSQMSSAMSGLNSILSGAVAVGAGAAALASGGLTIPQTIAAVSGIAGGATAAGLGMANIGRPTYNEQGGAGRNYGFLQPYNIYFMLFRPVQTVAENEVYYNGYQSRKTVTIENLENDSFSKMLSIRLPDSIPADVKGYIDNIMTSRGFYK